jgi:uncharacterized cupredoxin-like copper-binding protein
MKSSKIKSKRGIFSAVALTAAALLTLTACGGSSTDEAAAPADTAIALVEALPAGQWISNFGDFKEAANWDAAEVLALDLGAGTISPSNMVLQAGLPYEIQIMNNDTVDHTFSALDFMRASAVRKVESPGAEVKMRLFKDITVLAGQTMNLFAVPVIPGVMKMENLTDGVVSASGTISVEGTAPTTPTPVIESVSTVGEIAGADALLAAVDWTTATAITEEMGDNGDTHFYKTKVINLALNQPVILTFANNGSVLHEYTAEEFYLTCATLKVTSAEGETYGGIIRPADLEVGGVANLYIIPTKAGTYKVTDAGSGGAGMTATIVVK